jgi:hypothetical protein
MFEGFAEIGCLNILADECKSIRTTERRALIEQYAKAWSQDLGYLVPHGKERFVLLEGSQAYAVEYRDCNYMTQEYMDVFKLKHQILHFLLPRHFPNFSAAVAAENSVVGLAYTIRDRIQEYSGADDLHNRRVRLLAKSIVEADLSDLFDYGITIPIDHADHNYAYGKNLARLDLGPNFFYLDTIDCYTVVRPWQIDVPLIIQDFLIGRDPNKRPHPNKDRLKEFEQLVGQLEQAQINLELSSA